MSEQLLNKLRELIEEEYKQPEVKHVSFRGNDEALKRVEDRMLARFQVSENYMVNQMEEQSVALAFIVLAAMLMCFYVFYQIVVRTMHVNRCRCAEKFTDWDVVVRASKLILTPPPSAPIVASKSPDPLVSPPTPAVL